MSNILQQFFKEGFLQTGELDGKPIYHLTTPCRFNISQNVVKILKDKYLSDEEIGGILWAKPTIIADEKVYLVNNVRFLRNAIEDTPYKDKEGRLRTKKDAYRPDAKTHSEELQKIFSANYLPLKFHTHPTKGRDVLEGLTIHQLQTETSDQDKIESTSTHSIGNDNLLMPRGLIVGNGDLSNNIFIGLYNGFIAPVNFGESKQKVRQQQMQKIADAISSTTLSDGEKILLGIGAVLLLVAVVKYPKFSLPVIFGLALGASTMLSDTTTLEKPSYFNKLSFGDANIYIP
jgi:hypothetical protein